MKKTTIKKNNIKKIASIALVLAMLVMLLVPAVSAGKAPAEITVKGASVSASVDKLNGNQNKLHITLKDSGGSKTESFMISNNAEGTYPVSTASGKYEVYVNTKGNTKIDACYFVSFTPAGTTPGTTPGVKPADYTALDAAIKDAAGLKEEEYTAESWANLAKAVNAAKNVDRNLPNSSQKIIDDATAAVKAAIKALIPDDGGGNGDIVLTASQYELLATGEAKTVYFYAEVSANITSVSLYNANGFVAVMKDDGLYEISGDDILGDGIFTCKISISTSAAGSAGYYAVGNGNSKLKSNTVELNIIEQLSDSQIAGMAAVEQAIEEAKTAAGYTQAVEAVKVQKIGDLLDSLAAAGLIIKDSILYDDVSGMYSFTFSCDVLGGTMIREFSEYYNAGSRAGAHTGRNRAPANDADGSNSVTAAMTSENDDVFALAAAAAPPIGKALILNAFENTSFRRDYYPTVKTDWDNSGLATTIRTDVKVSDIKNLGGYNVVVFSGHGIYYTHRYGFLWLQSITNPAWVLNEKVTSATDKAYSNDLKQHRVIKVDKTYFVYPSLITNSYGVNDLSGCFIFSEACEFMGKNGNVVNTFADALTSRSAKAVVGFHNSVGAVYSREFMKIYIDSLISGSTAQSSFNTAIAQRGANDGGSPAAYPLLRGDGSATLISTSLKNGSFELWTAPLNWNTLGDVRVVTKLGELSPTHANRMALISTGIGSNKSSVGTFYDGTQGSYMQQTLKLSGSASVLSFDYNVVSEEPPEYIGSSYNDAFIVEILDANGAVLERLVNESVNTSKWLLGSPLTGFKLSVGAESGRPPYQIGWQSVSFNIEKYRNQVITIRFMAFDRGDQAFDTVGIVDNVVIK